MALTGNISSVDDMWLINHIYDFDVILVGTNTKNSLYNGFQRQLSISFPEVDLANNGTRYDDRKKLGTCNVIDIGLGTKVVLCYITEGRFRPDVNPDTVDYQALDKCMALVKKHFHGERMASTIVGCHPFEGGGNREKCLGVMEKHLGDEDISIFDFPQLSPHDAEKRDYHRTRERGEKGEINREEYLEEMSINQWHKSHGYYEPMPNLNYNHLMKYLKEERKRKR